MRKLILLGAATLFAHSQVMAQGWVGNSMTNSLYSVNAGLGLAPISIGVGTNSPTEQLHTTGGVRFQGLTNDNTLTQILAQDGTGKLHWRDYSTFNQGNFWGLTGNAGTNPAINYVGTSDAARLVFGTSATEKATILRNGDFGIGLDNPNTRLHVYDCTIPRTGLMPVGIYEAAVFEADRDTKLGVYNASSNVFSSTAFTGSSIILGFSNSQMGYTTPGGGTANAYPGFDMQVVGVDRNGLGANNNSVALRFNQTLMDNTGTVITGAGTSVENIMVMHDSKVGINLGPLSGVPDLPTAALHVDCLPPASGVVPSNLRLQNLPTGTGQALVVDANGYVYKTAAIYKISGGGTGSGTDEYSAEIATLKGEIAQLKMSMQALMDAVQVKSPSGKAFAIFPNPATNEINIKSLSVSDAGPYNYSIATTGGSIVAEGRLAASQTKIALGDLASGSYIVRVFTTGNETLQTEKISIVK
jgi:hypothetical protein